MLRLALFQPDIPQNTGTLLRLAACLGVAVDIIEPCGFLFDDKKLKRAGMDYLAEADYTRHLSWDDFLKAHHSKRLVLMTTKTDVPFTDFAFSNDDILIAGRESIGVPEFVHERVHAKVTIPMRGTLRSVNVAIASAMILTEALRQTDYFKAQERP